MSLNNNKNQNSNQDIFDKLIQLPILSITESFYRKYKEILLYLFFGGISFLLNLVLFILFCDKLGVNELLTNVICWIVCVLFQFFTNRTWVFDGKVNSESDFLKQISSFFGGRVFSLIVEELILFVFITWLDFNSLLIKLIAQIVVIVLNYVASKVFVFKKTEKCNIE